MRSAAKERTHLFNLRANTINASISWRKLSVSRKMFMEWTMLSFNVPLKNSVSTWISLPWLICTRKTSNRPLMRSERQNLSPASLWTSRPPPTTTSHATTAELARSELRSATWFKRSNCNSSYKIPKPSLTLILTCAQFSVSLIGIRMPFSIQCWV